MATKDLKKSPAAFDEVDFSSGFDTQYEQEYRPLKPLATAANRQDPKTLWYRDLNTILLLVFLVFVYTTGTVLLTKLVFTTNALYIFLIILSSVSLAMVVMLTDINSTRIR